MNSGCKRYMATGLFGLILLSAGCAAKDVSVQQRGPIRGEATVEGDRGRSDTESRREDSRTRSRSGGSTSGSGEAGGRSGY